ncbi:glycosyltransferase [Solihabitans fulvus]|uniref:Glycosyltransferase n=1 Tax=Solihabitans fulvus TaxID=1892852 RepID=A0A5B2WN26_9PSEU|nr:glycosyltransferase family 2 protein [Solihabitans fulvus]KAA2252180.1 glycosyltransferase [Solihabitans fulvus]
MPTNATSPRTVSVVIPAHHRKVELRRTLRSLTVQSLPQDRFEVIVVDDGSPEGMHRESVAALEKFASSRYLRHDTAKGVSAARNAGAAHATGDLLVFLDVDCMAHPDCLQAHLDAQQGEPIAACGYVYGRELTPAIWDLRLGTDWDLDDPAGTFARAADTPAFADPLGLVLNPPLPTDWAFFWTHNVSIPRRVFEACGGFLEDFEIKGVEDLEIGLRLQRDDVPTIFLDAARALHQPHSRGRHDDLQRDRRNDLLLLRRHPDPDVEAVCSFDIVNARDLVPQLESFANRLDRSAIDVAGITALPATLAEARAANRVLLLGAADGWPADLDTPDRVVSPLEKPGEPDRLPFLGTRLPFDHGHFDIAIVTDYWRLLPERTLCRILEELLRCSTTVFVLADVASAPAAEPDPVLSAALDRHDRPFWEFTVALRRELHQFELTEREAAPTGARAYLVTAVDWPTTRLP